MMGDTMMSFGGRRGALAVAIGALVCGCGGGGGGGGGGSGGAGGGGGSSGTGGASGACSVNGTFQGQPGTLWVEQGNQGQLTSYDTQDGTELTTVTAPGSAVGMTGGNGLLWLRNVDNDRMITPLEPTGNALTKLPIDADSDLVFAGGRLWTFGSDSAAVPNVYAITDPTSVTALPVGLYVSNAYTASSDGFFFLGSDSVTNPIPKMVHVDAAATQILSQVSVASAMPDWPNVVSPSLAVLNGKVFVKYGKSDISDALFSVDIASQAVSPAITIEANPGLIPLMTDGKGLYVFDAGKEVLHEVDPTTGATKRELELGVPASSDQTFAGGMVAAGGIWLGRNCGGKIYVRRVDIEAWTVADFEYQQSQGVAPQAYAYLAP